MYIKEGISYKVIEKTSNVSFQGLWIELQFPKKTNVLFHPRQRATANRLHIKVFDCEHNVFEHLEQKDCVKYLGVLIDSNLSWQYHINYISLKISKTIGIISRLRYVLPTSILLHIYRSLIHPYVSYGLSVWGQTSKSNLEKILILQKKSLTSNLFPQ